VGSLKLFMHVPWNTALPSLRCVLKTELSVSCISKHFLQDLYLALPISKVVGCKWLNLRDDTSRC
jgi:hypothetical protein